MLRELNEWQQEKPATLVDHSQDEAGVYGLLGVVLALILVNGKVLGDGEYSHQFESVFPPISQR